MLSFSEIVYQHALIIHNNCSHRDIFIHVHVIFWSQSSPPTFYSPPSPCIGLLITLLLLSSPMGFISIICRRMNILPVITTLEKMPSPYQFLTIYKSLVGGQDSLLSLLLPQQGVNKGPILFVCEALVQTITAAVSLRQLHYGQKLRVLHLSSDFLHRSCSFSLFFLDVT